MHQAFRRILRTVAASALAALAIVACTIAQEQWYPSRWGADDERGAANLLTPAKVLEAVQLVKQGKVYQLGRVYERGMPLYGNRQYNL